MAIWYFGHKFFFKIVVWAKTNFFLKFSTPKVRPFPKSEIRYCMKLREAE